MVSTYEFSRAQIIIPAYLILLSDRGLVPASDRGLWQYQTWSSQLRRQPDTISFRQEAFYVDRLAKQLYLNKVVQLLMRVNTITGIMYRCCLREFMASQSVQHNIPIREFLYFRMQFCCHVRQPIHVP